MLFSRRVVVAAVVMLLLFAAPLKGRAQGVAVAGLHVSARVAPACSVIADGSAANAAGPTARVVCSRSALRALRVSADPGSGEVIATVSGLASRQRLSGGEVVFTIEPRTVVVTLHF